EGGMGRRRYSHRAWQIPCTQTCPPSPLRNGTRGSPEAAGDPHSAQTSVGEFGAGFLQSHWTMQSSIATVSALSWLSPPSISEIAARSSKNACQSSDDQESLPKRS